MPFINVKLIEGAFTDVQKQAIARSLTDAMVAVAATKAVQPA